MKKKQLLPLGILAVLVLAALIYTRPMTLGSGFSGNNYYVGRRRYAQVRFTAWNGETKF